MASVVVSGDFRWLCSASPGSHRHSGQALADLPPGGSCRRIRITLSDGIHRKEEEVVKSIMLLKRRFDEHRWEDGRSAALS